jgi:hypothetical protein
MRVIRLVLCIVLLAALSCEGAGFIGPPQLPEYKSGYEECSDFAKGAEKTASAMQVLGWIVGSAGLSGLVIGPAMGPDETPDNWFEKHRNVEVAAAGGLLLLLGRAMITSSDDGATAAAAATRALKAPTGQEAYASCIDARADWLLARKNVNIGLLEELGKAEAARAKAEEEAAALRAASAMDAGVDAP